MNYAISYAFTEAFLASIMNVNALEIVKMHILLEENMILILLYAANQQPMVRNVETMKLSHLGGGAKKKRKNKSMLTNMI